MFEIIISTIATFLFLVLSAYIIIKQRTTASIILSLALSLLALIEVLDQLSLHLSLDPASYKRVVIFVESLLPATLLFFSMTYSRRWSTRLISLLWWAFMIGSVIFPISVFLFPLNDFFYSPDLQKEKVLFLGKAGYWFYMGMMCYMLIVLMNLEATFSATSGIDRWRMKFEVIGIISILSILIFYFSQGLLYRTINMNLIPIRSGVFISASIFVGYSKLFRGGGIKVEISRYIIYRSLTLLMVGLYLLFLGLIGEGMKYSGISFSRDLTIFIAFITGMAILLILFSEQLRRKVKVYISKHFYAHKHDYRAEWLNFTERLTSCGSVSDVQNAILITYREVFGLKGASLYHYDKGAKSYLLVANQGMAVAAAELQPSAALIKYFIERSRVLNPNDSEYTLAPQEASFVRQTRAKLIVPLVGIGTMEGFLILGKQLVQEKFIFEDYDLMKTFAKQATLSIINFRLSEELAETREVTAMAKISSFVIHDLKNLTSTLSLLMNNADNYIEDPGFQKDMINSVRNTLNKMKRLIQRLKTIPEKNTLNIELADIHLLTKDIVGEVMANGVNIIYHGFSAFSMVDKEEMKKVILNLILNALDAIHGEGVVEVETGNNGTNTYTKVIDNGCGMKEDFIKNHLFKPFRTTKKKGLGIGLYQCKQIVEAHGGKIEIKSKEGEGSNFTVFLPLAHSAKSKEGQLVKMMN